MSRDIGLVEICIIVFDIYLIISAIAGFVLDRAKKLLLATYPLEKSFDRPHFLDNTQNMSQQQLQMHQSPDPKIQHAREASNESAIKITQQDEPHYEGGEAEVEEESMEKQPKGQSQPDEPK